MKTILILCIFCCCAILASCSDSSQPSDGSGKNNPSGDTSIYGGSTRVKFRSDTSMLVSARHFATYDTTNNLFKIRSEFSNGVVIYAACVPKSLSSSVISSPGSEPITLMITRLSASYIANSQYDTIRIAMRSFDPLKRRISGSIQLHTMDLTYKYSIDSFIFTDIPLEYLPVKTGTGEAIMDDKPIAIDSVFVFFNFDGNMTVSLNRGKPETLDYERIQMAITHIVPPRIRSYTLGEIGDTYANYTRYYKDSLGGFAAYTALTHGGMPGAFTITAFDTIKRVLSATFDFQASDVSNSPIKNHFIGQFNNVEWSEF